MLEIQSLFYDEIYSQPTKSSTPPKKDSEIVQQAQPAKQESSPPPEKKEIYAMIAEMQSLSLLLERDLKFEYNESLEQIIVKVVDRETETIIKELPPEALQDMYIRIRQAIGIMIDEIM